MYLVRRVSYRSLLSLVAKFDVVSSLVMFSSLSLRDLLSTVIVCCDMYTCDSKHDFDLFMHCVEMM